MERSLKWLRGEGTKVQDQETRVACEMDQRSIAAFPSRVFGCLKSLACFRAVRERGEARTILPRRKVFSGCKIRLLSSTLRLCSSTLVCNLPQGSRAQPRTPSRRRDHSGPDAGSRAHIPYRVPSTSSDSSGSGRGPARIGQGDGGRKKHNSL